MTLAAPASQAFRTAARSPPDPPRAPRRPSGRRPAGCWQPRTCPRRRAAEPRGPQGPRAGRRPRRRRRLRRPAGVVARTGSPRGDFAASFAPTRRRPVRCVAAGPRSLLPAGAGSSLARRRPSPRARTRPRADRASRATGTAAGAPRRTPRGTRRSAPCGAGTGRGGRCCRSRRTTGTGGSRPSGSAAAAPAGSARRPRCRPAATAGRGWLAAVHPRSTRPVGAGTFLSSQ
mmetsp:Transcript_32419/g.100280  ORF Transcript_32419/g.100280 Transcript_32419/m.100280 type:complete len:231 (+) Transcript_32419:283-975(+)